jgi:hypothetical protein
MGKLNILYILHAMLRSIINERWMGNSEPLLPFQSTAYHYQHLPYCPRSQAYQLRVVLAKVIWQSGTSQLLTPVRRAMQVRKPGNLIILIYHFLPPFAVFVLGIALKIYKGKDY